MVAAKEIAINTASLQLGEKNLSRIDHPPSCDFLAK